MQETAFTIDALHAAYAGGMAPSDMIDMVFARHAAADDPGIFIAMASRDSLIAAVDRLGRFDPVAKPLWGIPFAVKDNIDVAGMPTTAACPDYAYLPEADAPVVARLKAAGAICVGKTNLDQFATGLVGVRSPWPIPRNVVRPELVPGGSSSGSAVATARGIVAFALGTDTAGSGRVPAALNGIVGLKPSLGALSNRGVVPACRTLDCVSIFARDVADAWRVFDVAADYDPSDAYSRARDVRAPADIATVGVPSAATIRFFGDTAQQAAFAAYLAALEGRGVRVVEVDFDPLYAVADMLYEGAWVAERLAAIADFMKDHEASLHPVTRRIIGGAGALTAVDAFNGFYRLQALKREAEAVMRDVDALCVPSIPRPYTLADLEADPIGPNSRLGTYTNFVNLLDMCGLAVPASARPDGMPFGVTFLARGGMDRAIADFALRLSAEGDGRTAGSGGGDGAVAIRPAAGGGADRIELVVVGAHLSGMPLNHELTGRDGRLLRQTTTTAEYRLFALPGTVPPKPGLLRVGPRLGGAIAVEVWSLAPAAFASFVSAIPAPLGIGRISLADGSVAQGFLVESIAVEAAEDVTRFGGWRNYMTRDAASPTARRTASV